MRKFTGRLHLIPVATVLLLVPWAPSRAADSGTDATVRTSQLLYMAVAGNDAWSGTLPAPNAARTDGPLASFEGARTAIRKLKRDNAAAGPITVLVRGGMYALPRTFELGAKDSGTPAAPIVYRAFKKEKPVVIGGRAITGWRPYRGGILQADAGVQGFKGVYFRQLFFNGRRQHLARYPNYDPKHPITGGWTYVDGNRIPMYKTIPGESKRTLKYKPGDVHEWAHPTEMEVMVFPRYNWWNNIISIAAIDRKTRTITLARDASYPNRPGDRYFFRNALEELDAPGEWYLDKRTETVYFLPPSELRTGIVYAPTLETLFRLDGATNVAIHGLTLECCEGTAVVLRNCTDCVIGGCTIRNVGGRCRSSDAAVAVNGGRNNRVAGNDIYQVGSNAIALNGGDRKTLTPARNTADNNYIHHTGVFYKQGVGVKLDGVGNRVSHNLIHDCPRFGIVWGGNDHIIEFNHIRHCTLETADTGAIYSWQVNWVKRGTEIRYNYIHDVIGFGQEHGKWVYPHMNSGIYLDDGTCGTHVHGNIIARTILGGVHIHGGRDNVIENNIFVDGRDSELVYSGYVANHHPVPMITKHWEEFSGTPAYDKYPGYAELKHSLKDAWQMAGNKFLRNIVSYSSPDAKLFRHSHLPFDKTESDYNLIWHRGMPLRTDLTLVKGITGPNLAPNPGFEEGAPGKMPPGWRWQVRPNKSEAGIDATEHAAGNQAVRVHNDGTFTDSSGQVLHCNFVSDDIPLTPGKTYRLSASVKTTEADTKFVITPQAYVPKKFFWAKSMTAKAGTQWKTFENIFRFPKPGDRDYHEGMDSIRIRFDVLADQGTIWIDNVDLREAVAMSEWEAWRAQGLDRHSVIADPRFVSPGKDDFRLKPDSPAFSLGFKPIPVDRIGPYEDDLRASWPIREAEGAREHMTVQW